MITKVKIYQLTNLIFRSFTLEINGIDQRIEFKGGGRIADSGVFRGGRFTTNDSDVIEEMEKTPWFLRGEIFIYEQPREVNASVKTPEVIVNNKVVNTPKVPSYKPLQEVEEVKDSPEAEMEVEEIKADDGLTTSNATDFQEARTFLKKTFPEVPPINFQSATKLKSWAKDNGVQFPNWDN